MGISWVSPEAGELQYIQTVGKKLSLAKGLVPVESTTVLTASMTGIETTFRGENYEDVHGCGRALS
jgi:hypothetical protein